MNIPSWPFYAEDEIQAAINPLKSGKVNFWTGKECRSFEQEFSDFVDVKYSIAVANGSLALELALVALGIGPGDEVVVPCRTFIATGSSVARVGAKPIVVDVDRLQQNIVAENIKKAINAKTKAIIPVHLNGIPCDMDNILRVAKQNDLFVIEDCAQAHGAHYNNRHVGSLSDIGVFSFCQDKIISTGGEGGIMVTSNEELFTRAWSYKEHGKNYATIHAKHNNGGYRWLHDSIGTNFRMTELQAAIGRCQLNKLNKWVEIRRRNANIYREHFEPFPTIVQVPTSDKVSPAYYKYSIFVQTEDLKKDWSIDRILSSIRSFGIPCQSGVCSNISKEKAFGTIGLKPVACSNGDEWGQKNIVLPTYPTLTERDISYIAESVIKVLKDAKP